MIKKKVLILGGGKSTEHEVSLVSAYNIFQNISSENYTALLVAIDKKGIWRHCEDLILDAGDISKVHINPEAPKIFIEDFIRSQKIDLVFPRYFASVRNHNFRNFLKQFLRLKILQGYDYLKQLFLILYLGSVFLPKF